MAGSVRDLAGYRLERARENLHAAIVLYDAGDYKASLNRSYYSIFHAIRAVNALDSFDSKKHSGVISHFIQYHVKNNEFPRQSSRVVQKASVMRENADYEDFFVASKTDANEQIRNAEEFLGLVEEYLEKMDDI